MHETYLTLQDSACLTSPKKKHVTTLHDITLHTYISGITLPMMNVQVIGTKTAKRTHHCSFLCCSRMSMAKRVSNCSVGRRKVSGIADFLSTCSPPLHQTRKLETHCHFALVGFDFDAERSFHICICPAQLQLVFTFARLHAFELKLSCSALCVFACLHILFRSFAATATLCHSTRQTLSRSRLYTSWSIPQLPIV